MNFKLIATGIIAVLCTVTLMIGLTSTTAPHDNASYEYMQVTTIESVVPGGLGRSRMITVDAGGTMEEVKLENFYSLVGINFQNVRDNDKMITQKITDLSKQGWELTHTTAGVESTPDKTGIFITRYLFRKPM